MRQRVVGSEEGGPWFTGGWPGKLQWKTICSGHVTTGQKKKGKVQEVQEAAWASVNNKEAKVSGTEWAKERVTEDKVWVINKMDVREKTAQALRCHFHGFVFTQDKRKQRNTVLISHRCGNKFVIITTYQLKPTQICSLTGLEVRSPKWGFLGWRIRV